MEKYKITKRNSNIVEINLVQFQDSHLKLQLLNDKVYCAISTYVNPNDRGKGIGKSLYECMIDYIRKEKAQFTAACPFIVDLADHDKTISDIYISKIV
jgi:predicted GNAT family acetyltransferase